MLLKLVFKSSFSRSMSCCFACFFFAMNLAWDWCRTLPGGQIGLRYLLSPARMLSTWPFRRLLFSSIELFCCCAIMRPRGFCCLCFMDKLAGQELSMEEVATGFASGNFRGARVLAAVLDGEGGPVLLLLLLRPCCWSCSACGCIVFSVMDEGVNETAPLYLSFSISGPCTLARSVLPGRGGAPAPQQDPIGS